MALLTAARRREQPTSRWCILRTSSRSTVALLDDLERSGFDVWTPTEVIERHVGRNRMTVERCNAMMKSFIFAAEGNVDDLLRLSADPMKQCVDFTVFHYRGAVPLIADRHLAPLRKIESDASAARDRLNEDRRRKEDMARQREAMSNERRRLAELRNSVDPIPVGRTVRMPEDGAWGGMTAIVVKSTRGVTTLSIGGVLEAKIDTFHLDRTPLEVAQP